MEDGIMNKVAANQFARELIAKCSGTDSLLVDNAITAIQSGRAYHIVLVPKKSGGTRITHEPCNELKCVQSGLSDFFYRWPVDKRMFGYVKEHNVVDSARFHLNCTGPYHPETVIGMSMPRWVLRLDLKDAFPSVTSKVLSDLYRKILNQQKLEGYKGLSKADAKLVYDEFIGLMLLLTTRQGRLPQGAPSSPYLLNLVLCHTGMISRIEAVCNRFKKMESRLKFCLYVDDIIVSSAKAKISDYSIRKLIAAIEADGIFKVNAKKTNRNSVKYKAHIINGVVLSSSRVKREERTRHGHAIDVYYERLQLTLPQKYLNSLRGRLHRLRLALEDYRIKVSELDEESSDVLLMRDFLNPKELMAVIGKVSWVKSLFEGSKIPLPSAVRKEIELFDEALKKSRACRRIARDLEQKKLQKFLREEFGKRRNKGNMNT